MKKSFLILLFVSVLSVVATASPLKAKSTSIAFSYAGEPQQLSRVPGVEAGSEVAEAFLFSADDATTFAGNYISEIVVYAGGNSSTNTNTIRNITVFLSHDLDGEPFYTQDAALGTGLMSRNAVKLTTPYLIEAGRPVYVGFMFTINSSTDYYLVLDKVDHGADGGAFVGVKSGGGWKWTDMSTELKSYLCIGATITGDNLPCNRAGIKSVEVPMQVAPGEKFDITLYITNYGADELEELKATWQLGSGEVRQAMIEPLNPKTGNPGPFIANGKTGYFKIKDVSCDAEGSLLLTVSIPEVNGVANGYTAAESYTSQIVCIAGDHAYKRNVVFEEWTGTWCGWCPRGLVMMEQMSSKYTDGSFIPIGVHEGDEMETESYAPFAQKWIDGYPGAVANRMANQTFDPSPTSGPKTYEAVRAIPSIATVGVKAVAADDLSSVDITSTTTFAVAESSGLYRIAYVVTENNVGPYAQRNYYAGGNNGKMGGWESLASYVAYTFNDVARSIYSADGIPGSLPAEANALQPCFHNYRITPETGWKLYNCNVVAMLINSATGVIENAAVAPIEMPASVGVTAATPKATVTGTTGAALITGDYTTARFYNLAGQTVATASGESTVSLPAGFYIATVDGEVTKITVR